VNVARFLERRSEAAQRWRWSLKLRRQHRPLRPAAGSASLADGGLQRENWPPIGVMIRGSAAAADQHFRGAIVIEPNLDRVWAALMTGAQPGRTPFTVLQLATSGLDGGPKVRGVILRSADAEQGAVSFFTDLRSAKVEEMRHQPRVSLIGYDADAGFQIRLEGKASIDTEGPEKAAAWAACRSHTRALFQHPLPSGTPIAVPPKLRPLAMAMAMAKGTSPWSSSRSSVSIGSMSLDLCTCARCFGATAAIGVAAGLCLRRRGLRSSVARRLHGRRAPSGLGFGQMSAAGALSRARPGGRLRRPPFAYGRFAEGAFGTKAP
jgi:pyridoxamine 5'-phosphate oxidase